MARAAIIIGKVVDAWGDLWEVREERPTKHGFPICLGWPAGIPRGRGAAGGPRVIVTAPLVAHMEGIRAAPAGHGLPIGMQTVRRIRKMLGHHWRIDRAQWWEERADELGDLTIEQFTGRYGVSAGAVVNARHALFGPKNRPAGWWRTPEVSQILSRQVPISEIAEALDISVGSVRRMRSMLNAITRVHHKMSEADIAKAAHLISGGATTRQVASALGISEAAITNRVRSGTLPPLSRRPGDSTKGYRHLNDDDLAKAAEMITAGATCRQVASALGVSQSTISIRIKSGYLPPLKRKRGESMYGEHLVAQAIEMRKSGLTYEKISESLRVSLGWVSIQLRRAADGEKGDVQSHATTSGPK